MTAVFKNHTVICGWNPRGRLIVDALQALGSRPIVVIAQCVETVIADVGDRRNVFVIVGDCANLATLIGADVAHAKSVMVLADDSLGQSADARSVKVALAVEKIQVSVHTAVELRDIRNKPHFNWTKVDEVIADEEISVKMLAQGIRHILSRAQGDTASLFRETLLLDTYNQLVSPSEDLSQLFRVDFSWSAVKSLCFEDFMRAGIGNKILPVAIVGYKRHEILERPGQGAWVSWKTDVCPNPESSKKLDKFWPEWPEGDYQLGIIVFADSLTSAMRLKKSMNVD